MRTIRIIFVEQKSVAVARTKLPAVGEKYAVKP